MSLLDQLFQNSCRNQELALSLIAQSTVSMRQSVNLFGHRYQAQKNKTQSPFKKSSLLLGGTANYASAVSVDLSNSQSTVQIYEGYRHKASEVTRFKTDYLMNKRGLQIIFRVIANKLKDLSMNFMCVLFEQCQQPRTIQISIQMLQAVLGAKQRALKQNAMIVLKNNCKSKLMGKGKRQNLAMIKQLKALKKTQFGQWPLQCCVFRQETKTRISTVVAQRFETQNIDYSYNTAIFLIDEQQRDQIFNNCIRSDVFVSKDRFENTKSSFGDNVQALQMTPACRPCRGVLNDPVYYLGVASCQSQGMLSQSEKMGVCRDEGNTYNSERGRSGCVSYRKQESLFETSKTRQFLEESRNSILGQIEEEEQSSLKEEEMDLWPSPQERQVTRRYFCEMEEEEEVEATRRELKALMSYRKEKEQRRISTLHEIEKSKEIIQQLVAEFKESKQIKRNRKLKLIPRKQGKDNSSVSHRQKPLHTAVKRSSSPWGQISSTKNYSSVKKVSAQTERPKYAIIGRDRSSEGQIIKSGLLPSEWDYSSNTLNNIQNQAQLKDRKPRQCVAVGEGKKAIPYNLGNGSASQRKCTAKRKDNIQSILSSLSKVPACSEKRIDLKVNLVKENRRNIRNAGSGQGKKKIGPR